MAIRTVTHYLRLLQSLLPWGKAWSRDDDSTLTEFLKAQADEFVRLDSRSVDLQTERDVRATQELISEHETDLGIPDECIELAGTLQERRDYAHSKLIAQGRQDKQYFIDLAAAAGYTITITEFAPDTFHWQVNVYGGGGSEWVYFRSGGSVSGDPLIYGAGFDLLQCLLDKYKPAHTTVEAVLAGYAFDEAFGLGFDSFPSSITSWLEGAFGRGFGNGFDRYRGGSFGYDEFGDGFNKPI